jgi:hypothetical protein
MAFPPKWQRDNGLNSRKVTMPEIDADKFRKQAEACEERAAKTTSELDKEAWAWLLLGVAADWLKLAEDAEKQRVRKD